MKKILTRLDHPFNSEEDKLLNDCSYLGIKADRINIYDCYDFLNAEDDEIDQIEEKIFREKNTSLFHEIPDLSDRSFRYCQVNGQYNEREDMVEKMVRIEISEKIQVQHSRIIEFLNISEKDFEKFKNYHINPMENQIIPMEGKERKLFISSHEELDPVEGFRDFTDEELDSYKESFSFDLDDIRLCRDYFRGENRDPNITELKMIDTYWSDHCRHTTFHTILDKIEVEEGDYREVFERAIEEYLKTREDVYGENKKPKSLMDLATINAKEIKQKGLLDDLDESDEVNACCINIEIEVDGNKEDWLLYFKNETHNHPTEIEPFGGASTCIGGGIRDPLSGRAFVYQGLRITGSKDPRTPYEETIEGKRAPRQICRVAMEGFSDYANQIGSPLGQEREYYHPGFEAKRLELGALVAAAPKENVVREKPIPGDLVVLVGARTGRDGLGAAVGSSKEQSEESLEKAGTDVQKGNPLVERKIIRLFNRKEVSRLIKKCNDFGAGGVSVAIGELADGLKIDLDKVPVKYPGMHGGEIALSESQERMACLIGKEDLEDFLKYAREEDVEATLVAEVTEEKRIVMYSQGEKIIDVKRSFLDSNGAEKHQRVKIGNPEKEIFENEEIGDLKAEIEKRLSDINNCSQENIYRNFDQTIYSNNVLYPLGGKNKLTPQIGMVAKIPVFHGNTDDCSIMTYSYDPYLMERSPFHGGYYAVIEAYAKNVALGGDPKKVRLSMQEFFESLEKDEEKWGKPTSALLGAFSAMKDLDLPAIGGKDSMSGTYEDINVPPSLICVSVAMTREEKVVSREFKELGSSIVYIDSKINEEGLIDLDRYKNILNLINRALEDKKILAISTVSHDGAIVDLMEMAFGNDIAFEIGEKYQELIFNKTAGSIILETKDPDYFNEFGEEIGKTNKEIIISGETIDKDQALKTWQAPLDGVYDSYSLEDKGRVLKEKSPLKDYKKKKVLSLILPGTTGEFDLEKEFTKRGSSVDELIFKTGSKEDFQKSKDELVNRLGDYDILAIADGAVMGNEPDMEGKLLELILRDEKVAQAIEAFIKKGYIIGIGQAFKGLIRSGLIENGRISDTRIGIKASPNKVYMADYLNSQVVNDSPFSKIGDSYQAPLSTKYPIIDLPEDMKESKQIISKFESFFEGEEGIDAMVSPDGRVFGSVSSFERQNKGLVKNIGKIGDALFIDRILGE